MSVVAISSEGPTLSDAVDPRFGRAGGFVIARYSGDEDAEISYLDNGEAQMLPQGAGIKTAENLSEAGVDTVLSGYVGPNAEEALLAAEIRVVQNMDGTSVGEALKKWRQMERDSSPA